MTPVVFIDLDGTLIDYDRAIHAAVADLVLSEPAWLHVEPAVAARAWRASRRHFTLDGMLPLAVQRERRLATIAADLGVVCDEADVTSWSTTIGERAVAGCRLYPDALELLDRAGPLGIITNGDRSVQEAKLTAAGVDPARLDPFIASMHVGHAKPAPEIFQLAAFAVGAAPVDCAMIGDDRRADVDAALAAGFGAAMLVDRSTPLAPGAVPTVVDAYERLRGRSPVESTPR